MEMEERETTITNEQKSNTTKRTQNISFYICWSQETTWKFSGNKYTFYNSLVVISCQNEDVKKRCRDGREIKVISWSTNTRKASFMHRSSLFLSLSLFSLTHSLNRSSYVGDVRNAIFFHFAFFSLSLHFSYICIWIYVVLVFCCDSAVGVC